MRAGESDYALHFCEHLRDRGWSVTLVTSARAGLSPPAGIEMVPIMTGWSWRELARLRRALRAAAPDQIFYLYIGWNYGDRVVPTYLPWLAKRWVPAARFTTVMYNAYGAAEGKHSWPERLARKIMSLRVGKLDSCYEFGTLLSTSDRIIVFCQRHFDFLRKVDPAMLPRTHIVPPPPLVRIAPDDPTHRAATREGLGIGGQELAVGFFGLLYPGKGVDTLLEAIARVRKAGITLRPVIIGGTLEGNAENGADYVESLRQIARGLSLENACIWTGPYASGSLDASQWLGACDLAALPFQTGISLNNSSVAAVMAHGLPLVSTRGQDLESSFSHGINVWLVPPGDSGALAGALECLATNAALRKRLGDGARALARECFSWDRAMDRIEGTVIL